MSDSWAGQAECDFKKLYIVNFMATFDANHINWNGGKEIVVVQCEYALAKEAADKAWPLYRKGTRK